MDTGRRVSDIRRETAELYDLAPHYPDDIPFYVERLPSADARVLELGCGTGRVSLPLASHCSSLHGLDLSYAMIEIFRSKIEASDLTGDRIRAEVADICDFRLGARFDYIIAPFRVMQNLETDDQLAGLFRCIKAHLTERGHCILNAFNPNRGPEQMRTEWVSDHEVLAWELQTERGLLKRFGRRVRVNPQPLVLYPELIDRLFVDGEMVRESVLRIPMRCHYPQELLQRIEGHGFTVLEKWGGYSGEEYGVGGELVVEFGVKV